MIRTGFIMLSRDFLEWEWYTDINTCKVFLHCLIKVNYSSKKWQGILIEKGQFITSTDKLAVETGLTVSKVRTALSKLESTDAIAIETTTSYTKITILNLDNFVVSAEIEKNGKRNGKPNSKRNDNEISNDSQTVDKQIATTKKNNNNIINRKKIFRDKVFALSNFNIKILESFFNYWSEFNLGETEMRFEKEQFFEVEKRLTKWKDNERFTNSKYKPETQLQTNRKSA